MYIDVHCYINEAIEKLSRLDVALVCANTSYFSTSILDTDVEQYGKAKSC